MIPSLEDLREQLIERYCDVEWADRWAEPIRDKFIHSNDPELKKTLRRTRGEPFRRFRLHNSITKAVGEVLFPPGWLKEAKWAKINAL